MANAITTLETTVSADALWGVFGNVVPFVRDNGARWVGLLLNKKTC